MFTWIDVLLPTQLSPEKPSKCEAIACRQSLWPYCGGAQHLIMINVVILDLCKHTSNIFRVYFRTIGVDDSMCARQLLSKSPLYAPMSLEVKFSVFHLKASIMTLWCCGAAVVQWMECSDYWSMKTADWATGDHVILRNNSELSTLSAC